MSSGALGEEARTPYAIKPYKEIIMFESHQSQNQAIWIASLSDHRTRLAEAQEVNRTRQSEPNFIAWFSYSHVLGYFTEMLAGLVGKHAALRGPAIGGQSDAPAEPGSLQACC